MEELDSLAFPVFVGRIRRAIFEETKVCVYTNMRLK